MKTETFQKIKLGWLLAILIGCCFLLAKTCRLEKQADAFTADVELAFSSSPSAVPLVRPVPSVDPAEAAELKRHHAAIDRCSGQGRIAVIGYGWVVVCLDPKVISWSEEPPRGGHDPGGL